MIRYALVLSLGIIAASCVFPPEPVAQQAQVLQQPHHIPLPVLNPQLPPVVIALGACASQGITTGASFVQNKVQLLNDPANPTGPVFEPTTIANSFPLGTGTGIVSSTRFNSDLAAAFDAAPAFFKDQLCGLTAVFVNLDQCASVTNCSAADELANSWGLRRILSGTLGRYVALSGGLWNGGAHAPNYHSYESMLLKQLLAWPETVSGAPFFPPTAGLGDPTDSPRFTVLAALAHEFGHVLWYDVNDPAGTGSYDPNTFCLASSASFFSGSWRIPVNPPPRWREFGDPQGDHEPNAGSDNVQIVQVFLAMARRQYRAASALVNRIYAPSGRWASLFAAFSPDEDFIETFKFDVLRQANPPLQFLTIQFPLLGNVTQDVPGTIGGKAELKR